MGEDKEEVALPKRKARKRWEGTNTFIPKTTVDSSLAVRDEEPANNNFIKKWFIPLKSNGGDYYEPNMPKKFSSPIQNQETFESTRNEDIEVESYASNSPTPKRNNQGGIILGAKAADFLFS